MNNHTIMITDQDKQNGLEEIKIINRALRRCKWYHFTKKKILNAHKDLIKSIYEI